MYYQEIFTESLAHYSYVIGDDQQLIVIDPQADIDLYLDISLKQKLPITTILETHRNEDFLVGSKALAKKCNAKVYISDEKNLDYQYGERIKDGQSIDLNKIKIKAIHTPGHTLGHMSYVLYYKEKAHMVFCGDLLFFGDIGRADFYGKENLDKMFSMMYDSIFNKLLSLGDDVILKPAHGSGSACGESIDDREFSTIGYERKHNPKVQYNSKEEFVKNNKKMLFKPHYFEKMEKGNLSGNNNINENIEVNFIEVKDIKEEKLIDVRSQDEFNKKYLKNSVWIAEENLLSFIHWLSNYQDDLVIIGREHNNYKTILKDLLRIGYEGKISFILNFKEDLALNVNKQAKIETIYPKQYIKDKEKYFILDVRKESEVKKESTKENELIIPIEKISENYHKLKDKENIVVVCPSGIRSNTVASFLQSKNIKAKVLIGGLKLLDRVE